MAIYVLIRKHPSRSSSQTPNLATRFAAVHDNIEKDLKDRSEFSELSFIRLKAKIISLLPISYRAQSNLLQTDPIFRVREKITNELPNMESILTDYAALQQEYMWMQEKASSRPDILKIHQDQTIADKTRSTSKRVIDALLGFQYPISAIIATTSIVLLYTHPKDWISYSLTLLTLPIGFVCDRVRSIYQHMQKPRDQQIVGVGSIREFEAEYIQLNTRLRTLRRNVSDSMQMLTELEILNEDGCNKIDSVLVKLLKDVTSVSSETEDLLKQLTRQDNLSDPLLKEASRVLNKGNPYDMTVYSVSIYNKRPIA